MDSLLVFDSTEIIYSAIKSSVQDCNFKVEHFTKLDELLRVIKPNKYSAIFFNNEDCSIDSESSTKMFIQIIKRLDQHLPIIVIADQSSLESEIEIRSEGIFYYMVKPLNVEEINSILDEIKIKAKKAQ